VISASEESAQELLYELCETVLTYNLIIYTVKMEALARKEEELINSKAIINNTKIEYVRTSVISELNWEVNKL
jgi:hypothetical protein